MEFAIHLIDSGDNEQILRIGQALSFLRKDYPGFRKWFNQTVIKEVGSSRRQIYVASPIDRDDIIAGVMILKNTTEEKKICTLFVAEDYRTYGIGSRFVKLAINRLGTMFPVITVSGERNDAFFPFLQKFGFTLYGSYFGYYRETVVEYSYNGPIEPACQEYIACG